jgi:glyoxylase-like metal-dependent hydrolase (beta-lactamase superfamily II)
MQLATRPYTRGLHDLGDGCYAWLQPDGGWGWSNAGLVTDGDEALLVDTLFDTRLTQDMLAAMRKAHRGSIGTLVNTHHNGDHCYGNSCVHGAQIIASEHALTEMKRETPQVLAQFVKAAPGLGDLGRYIVHCFAAFDFDGVTVKHPDVTFSGRLTRKVGDKRVELIEVGPAHTGGDILVHVPGDRTVFTGDILFIGGHPVMWAGPSANWIAACDLILEMDVETIVPGHGPVTDKHGVRAVRDYLVYVRDQARQRYDCGMKPFEAAQDISLADYSTWGDAERIAVNVATLYREFGDTTAPTDPATLFGWMAQIYKDRQRN